MNFTSDIKKEIISQNIKSQRKKSSKEIDLMKKAALSAFVRTSGELGVKDGIPTFFIVSETENVAEYFISLFVELFSTELSVARASMDRMSGRDKLVLQCPLNDSERILRELGLLKGGKKEFKNRISSSFMTDRNVKIAYIKGAFLGGGSCTIPSETRKTGYHLEFVFSERKIAEDFCELLWGEELLAKEIKRKETYVVYIKNKEPISDFLSIIGAKNCLKKFFSVVDKRDESNQSNRAANCFSGNADKTAQAAVKQTLAIERIKKTSGLDSLTDDLKELALYRLENPAMSLQELADSLKISKSCLNHRMRRLMEISEKTNG
jgi:DNA-binding protein WhiA